MFNVVVFTKMSLFSVPFYRFDDRKKRAIDFDCVCSIITVGRLLLTPQMWLVFLEIRFPGRKRRAVNLMINQIWFFQQHVFVHVFQLNVFRELQPLNRSSHFDYHFFFFFLFFVSSLSDMLYFKLTNRLLWICFLPAWLGVALAVDLNEKWALSMVNTFIDAVNQKSYHSRSTFMLITLSFFSRQIRGFLTET